MNYEDQICSGMDHMFLTSELIEPPNDITAGFKVVEVDSAHIKIIFSVEVSVFPSNRDWKYLYFECVYEKNKDPMNIIRQTWNSIMEPLI